MSLLPSSEIPTVMDLYPDKFIIHPCGCWLFTGYLSKKGYGQVRYGDKIVLVHRLSAHLSLGLDMSDTSLHALHKITCFNKNCANPDHLYLGDNFDNQRDSVLAGTHVSPNRDKTHCKHGHPLSGDNVYIPSDGRRRCKTCRAITQQQRYNRTPTTTGE